MKLIAEEYPHRNPWWTCLGCWKILVLVAAYAVVVGLFVAGMLQSRS